MVKLFKRYDVDVKIIDTSNCEDVGSMSQQEFQTRKSHAYEPDINEIVIINEIKNL